MPMAGSDFSAPRTAASITPVATAMPTFSAERTFGGVCAGSHLSSSVPTCSGWIPNSATLLSYAERSQWVSM
jgi:hypothetical protein